MRVHILGICGTFMAGIAVLARQAGHDVTGSDQNVYPPMSTQLEAQGIRLMNGYDAKNIDPSVDFVIVGNVISRGNPEMEAVLNQQLPYISGPQWLYENILKNRHVLAVSGTHGKTTTTSLLTWILDYAGLNPGFLIGGVPENFGVSARMGSSPYFVIEADEYDSAYFDKRSKFMHYRPQTLILNNLEFDHADIFSDLDAIKQQFHFLVRTVPGKGLIVKNAEDQNLTDVLNKGCWSSVETFSGDKADWQAKLIKADGSCFEVFYKEKLVGKAEWSLLGNHNVSNALAALAAAKNAGVEPEKAVAALTHFKNVKRRLEIRGEVNGITIYDDFAHHPTAIATTLAGLRAKIGKSRIIAVLEFGSYTMRSGVHKNEIEKSLADADMVICKKPDFADWGLGDLFEMHNDVESIVTNLKEKLRTGDHVVVMSNSGFGGIHQKLLNLL